MNAVQPKCVSENARPPITPPAVWHKAVFLALALFCITPWSSAPVALTTGFVIALAIGNPYPAFSKRTSPILLQTCVVLLGFGMNLQTVLRAGARGFLFAAVTIAGTFVLGRFVGHRLRVPRVTSTLISAGTAICGGSAIAAVGSVISAPAAEMSVALATVFLLNAVALYVFPAIGHFLGLSQTQFGTWAGVAIHDISSVVGASSRYGLEAMQTATAVKLSRALWIAPVSLMIGSRFRAQGETDSVAARRAPIPAFIVLFLLASLIRTVCPGLDALTPTVARVSKAGLALSLFLIGGGISRRTLSDVGWKPMLQGVIVWFFIAVVSLLVIAHTIR